MSRSLQLRPAAVADADCLAALSIQVWLQAYARDGVRPALARHVLNELSGARFAADLQSGRDHWLLAHEGVHVLGYARWSLPAPCVVDGRPGAELKTLYVMPRFAGRGLGRQLVNAAAQRCRDQHCASLWASVWSGNDEALAFYRHQQFAVVGESRYSFEGETHPNTVVRLDLNAAPRAAP
jgi:ribosomal protein S18 acetylase RimI-like enzyme